MGDPARPGPAWLKIRATVCLESCLIGNQNFRRNYLEFTDFGQRIALAAHVNLGAQPKSFGFGKFEVDLAARVLYRSGNKVPIQDQPFRILILLLEKPGAVVSRQELRQLIWPADTFVDFERSLNTAMRKLRKALGDDPDMPRYIETVRSYGYRFVGQLRSMGPPQDETAAAAQAAPAPVPAPVQAPALVSDAPRGVQANSAKTSHIPSLALAAGMMLIGLGLVGWGARSWLTARASGQPIRSIAVLPLENLTGDPKNDFIAEGLTDALITNLAQMRSVSVTSRTSGMAYKGTGKPLSQIARELNVDAIVEGTVSKSNGSLRVSAQLIRANTDSHLWAGEYEGQLSDLLALQANVTRAIGERIHAVVSHSDSRSPSGKKPAAANSQSYELYLRGRYFWNKRGADDIDRAIDSFHEALEANPGFAQAYAGLADCYTLQILNGYIPQQEGVQKAKAAAAKALALDDTLAEAHTALAGIEALYEWNWPAASREFQRALELNPSYAPAHHWYAQLYLAPMGRLDEALAEMNRAHDLDPLNEIILTDLGYTYYLRHEYVQAKERYQRVLELDPEYVPAHMRLHELYQRLGDYDDSIWEVGLRLRYAYKKLGSSVAREIEQAYKSGGYNGFLKDQLARADNLDDPWFQAEVHVLLGKNDRALSELSRAVAEREPILIYLKVDPAYDSIRSDPRFQELVQRVGLSE